MNVTVTGRLIEESICKGKCQFIYGSSLTNNVTLPNSTLFKAGQTVNVTGSDLKNAIVIVGGIKVNLTRSNSSFLSFFYPALKYGYYEI